ncbi:MULTISPECIES: serine/threonine-protein kinase [unclassified Streptomyces]|uniref:serine/threonine-protein kinase n=1 Tax=unclassified Streptomyces TaxID=2593676 RepID=UPI0028856748|nr:serine/threonine-protein kinase [Streptomyces sp. DSM 41633]
MLGQGGMGRVLLGAGPDGRLVAVKQVLAHFADDEGFRARFRREVAASRKAPGIYTAAVMDADPDAPTPWLASVFVRGPSLGAAVEAVGVLPEETVRRLAAGLATALLEIHRVGLVHRDLKPDNVLLAEDGVRVIDLGIARMTEGEGNTGLTRTGWVIGSPSFMSPEQAESKPLTPASDVFSLGSVLVMAVTGSSPFAGTSTLQTLYDVVHSTPT